MRGPFDSWACNMHKTSTTAATHTQKCWYGSGDHLLYSTIQVWRLCQAMENQNCLSCWRMSCLSGRTRWTGGILQPESLQMHMECYGMQPAVANSGRQRQSEESHKVLFSSKWAPLYFSLQNQWIKYITVLKKHGEQGVDMRPNLFARWVALPLDNLVQFSPKHLYSSTDRWSGFNRRGIT